MAHNLRIQNGKASMFYVGNEPWHGLGTKLEGPATAQEAISAAKLNWQVVKIPLYAGEDGKRKRRVPNRFAIVPEHLWGKKKCPVFGIVGSEYTPLQNHEAFEFFDSIVGSKAAIYHTAGALGDGERIWILAKLPRDIHVTGDDIANKFLLLSNTHDGNNSVQIKFTPVRVVCQNTLTMALSHGPNLRVFHTQSVPERLKQAERLLGIVNKHFDDLGDAFKRMSSFQMGNGKLQSYLSKVFPDPPETDTPDEEYYRKLGRARHHRDWSRYFFENGAGNQVKEVAGTLWCAYNGIGELIDHCQAKPDQNADRRLESVWFGDGYFIKARAFREAEELLGHVN